MNIFSCEIDRFDQITAAGTFSCKQALGSK